MTKNTFTISKRQNFIPDGCKYLPPVEQYVNGMIEDIEMSPVWEKCLLPITNKYPSINLEKVTMEKTNNKIIIRCIHDLILSTYDVTYD